MRVPQLSSLWYTEVFLFGVDESATWNQDRDDVADDLSFYFNNVFFTQPVGYLVCSADETPGSVNLAVFIRFHNDVGKH